MRGVVSVPIVLLAAVFWALLELGGAGFWSPYRLLLAVVAAALLATWTLSLSPRFQPSTLITLAAGILLTVRVLVEPPLFGRGYVLAALGVIVYGVTRWLAIGHRRALLLLARGLVVLGGVEACWGLLQPRPISGTFFNPNHFAGFLNMTLGLALGFACGAWPSRRAAGLWAGVAVILAAGVVASGSRAGVATSLLTLIFAAFLLAWRRARRGRSALGWLAAAWIATAVLGIGVERTLSRTDLSDVLRRLTLYQDTVELIFDHPAAGVGAGMYAWYFRPYQTFDTGKRFDHAHSDLLEVAAEWGIPVAAALLLFVVWQIVTAARVVIYSVDVRGTGGGRGDRGEGLQLGAAAASFALMIHGLVDFQLPMSANLMAFAMVLGMCGQGPTTETTEHRRWPRLLLSFLLITMAVAAGRQLLALEVGRRALVAGDLERAALQGPRWPSFHFRLGTLYRDAPEHRDLAAAKRSLELAAELNPYSWRYRQELARFFENAGRLDLAEQAYVETLARNPRGLEDRYRTAGFYLRRGDPRRGRILLRQVLVEDESRLVPGAELLLSLGMSPVELAHWWPRHPPARRALVEVLSRDAVETGAELLDAAWQDWLESIPPPSISDGDFYVERLLDAAAAAVARQAWIELASVNGLVDEEFVARRNELWNGGFEKEITGGALGWKVPDMGDASVLRAPVGKDGDWSLQLTFSGGTDFRRVRQLAAVEPGAPYLLSFAVRSENLDSPHGIRLQVLDLQSREVLTTSASLSGTVGWRRFEKTFETIGPLVVVRLAVPPDGAGERTVIGELWLDAMVLRQVEE